MDKLAPEQKCGTGLSNEEGLASLATPKSFAKAELLHSEQEQNELNSFLQKVCPPDSFEPVDLPKLNYSKEVVIGARDENGKLIGALVTRREPNLDATTDLFIQQLKVDSEHDNKFVGKKLVDKLLDFQKSRQGYQPTIYVEFDPFIVDFAELFMEKGALLTLMVDSSFFDCHAPEFQIGRSPYRFMCALYPEVDITHSKKGMWSEEQSSRSSEPQVFEKVYIPSEYFRLSKSGEEADLEKAREMRKKFFQQVREAILKKMMPFRFMPQTLKEDGYYEFTPRLPQLEMIHRRNQERLRELNRSYETPEETEEVVGEDLKLLLPTPSRVEIIESRPEALSPGIVRVERMDTPQKIREAFAAINDVWKLSGKDELQVPPGEQLDRYCVFAARAPNGDIAGANVATWLSRGGAPHLRATRIGILPKYANHGIGTKLTEALGEEAARCKSDRVTLGWLFDPLKQQHSHLYISKFPAICSLWHWDPYKGIESPHYYGLHTHRFSALWLPYVTSDLLKDFVTREDQLRGPLPFLKVEKQYIALAESPDPSVKIRAQKMQADFFIEAGDLIEKGFLPLRFKQKDEDFGTYQLVEAKRFYDWYHHCSAIMKAKDALSPNRFRR